MVSEECSSNCQDEIINLKEISKSYENKKILNNISLNIYPGNIYAVIGPNGAGKTTLLRVILNLIGIDGGSIKRNYTSNEISFLLENDYLYESNTGIENIKIFSAFFGTKNVHFEDSIERYMDLLNISNDMDLKVAYYSKGMKRKLSLLIILMRNTKVIVLDELTSGIDPQSRVEMRNILNILKDEGKTIIISSHDLSEVEKISDYILILEKGNIIKNINNTNKIKNLEDVFLDSLTITS